MGVVKTFSGLSWSLRLFLPNSPSIPLSFAGGQTCTVVESSPCLLRSLPFPFTDSSPSQSPTCVILSWCLLLREPKVTHRPFPRRCCPSYRLKPFRETARAHSIFHINSIYPSTLKCYFLRIPIAFGTLHLAFMAFGFVSAGYHLLVDKYTENMKSFLFILIPFGNILPYL